MTKKGISLISLVVCMLALPVGLNAQCKQFAKNTCKSGLNPYQHDGNYTANLLVEGDEADFYKTCHSEINYRIGVCGSNNLSAIVFKVLEARSNKVLYDNSLNDFDWKWDFNVESSMQVRVIIKVPVAEESVSEPEEGCVAIMFGSTDY